MKWMQSKFFKFIHFSVAVQQKHYGLHHRGITWPRIHTDCLCTFNTIDASKSHLSRLHRTVQRREFFQTTFHYWLCDFRDISCKKKIWIYLHLHLRNRETVSCPFIGTSFETNLLNSFTDHWSRKHKNDKLWDFRGSDGVVNNLHWVVVVHWLLQGKINCTENVDFEILEDHLASLFLCMQCLLHLFKHRT